MLATLAFVLGGLVVVVAARTVAGRTGIPASVLLVVAGIVYGFLPGPNLSLDPEVVLDTHLELPEVSAARVVRALEERGFVEPAGPLGPDPDEEIVKAQLRALYNR